MARKKVAFQRVGVPQGKKKADVCPACKTPMVWALDDRYPDQKLGSLFNVEPDPDGFAVLYFEVDRHEIPVDGRQWFRIPPTDYQGPKWSRHLYCKAVQP